MEFCSNGETDSNKSSEVLQKGFRADGSGPEVSASPKLGKRGGEMSRWMSDVLDAS